MDGQRTTPGGLGGEVVTKTTRDLERDLNYKVFADNFLNLPLFEALKAKSIYFVRTFRANTFKGLSPKSEKELKRKGRGACDVKVDGEPVTSRWTGSL